MNATAIATLVGEQLSEADSHWWGTLVEIILLLYCFAGLAVVCDEYLVPNLEILCVKFKVREDVAGASLMAVGSAAPEIIVNGISTLKATEESYESVGLGLGAILGSSVIAFSLIPGCCVLFSTGDSLALKRRPLLRDILGYSISLALLLMSIQDGLIELWESAFLLGTYAIYLLVVFFSPNLRRTYRVKFLKESLLPRQSFVERARLEALDSDCAYLLETEISRYDDDGSESILQNQARLDQSEGNQGNAHVPTEVAEGDDIDVVTASSFLKRSLTNALHTSSKSLEPIKYVCNLTCPSSEDKYPVAIVVSFLWVSVFSFGISSIVEHWGRLSHLPLAFFGFFLVSLGAEVPDTVQSVTVARRGYGSMAVSNAMGSQICNICIGLGLPWTLATLSGREIKFPQVKFLFLATYLQFFNIAVLMGMLFIPVVLYKQEKAFLTKKKGLVSVGMYVFIVIIFASSLSS